MSDYNIKVIRKQGGDELVVKDGGKITVETGGTIETPEGVFVVAEFDSDYFTVTDGVVTIKAEVAAQLAVLAAIPTADPQVSGQVWNDSGVLKVSAGA